MAKNRILRILLVWFGIPSALGCANSALEVSGPLSIPEGWSVRTADEEMVKCTGLNGIYENAGSGTFGENSEMAAARLDAALGRAVPPAYEPDEIEILFDDSRQRLSIRYLGAQEPYSWSEPAKCEDGWLSWVESQSEQYLGDGVTMDESRKVTRIALGGDIELIVHASGRAVYSQLFFIKDQEMTEWWAKFPRARREN